MVERIKERQMEDEIAAKLLDIPSSEERPTPQYFVSLEGQSYLLSIVNAEKYKICRVFIQGPSPVKVDDVGPIEPFNQLIFSVDLFDDKKIKLEEKNGYQDIQFGTEKEFLHRLFSEGDWFEIDKIQ